MKEDNSNATSSRTKRRRTNTAATPSSMSSTNKPEPVVVDIWKLEEEQAASRDVEKEYQLARQACGNIRRLLKEILELKLNKGTTAEKMEKRIQFLMLILCLKKFNRLEKIHNKRCRDLTNEVKAKVDAHHLKLLNLQYEITHLTKEVNKCLEFKSRDEDIKLIPVEEFYKVAPSEISRTEVTKHDLHAQTLARLDYELMQRKRLAAKYKESDASKERLLQEIKNKEEFLDSLVPSLNNILQATLPVQERLKMKQETKRRQHQMANLLSTPLFILYVKMNAYAEAWDNAITVTVDGDHEEAKAMKQSAEENDEESGESDQEDSQGKNRYRRSTTDRLTEVRKKVLRKHPLTVSSLFTSPACTLKLQFYYLVTLNVVTVKSELQVQNAFRSPTVDVMTKDYLLEYLFDNDAGRDTPNESNHYQLQRWGMDDFKSYIPELGRPFMWAQRLAGLEFIRVTGEEKNNISKQVKPNANLSGSLMEETVLAIKRRIEARFNLQKQICALEQGEVPCVGIETHRVLTRLTSFTSIAWDDYKEFKSTEDMINIDIVDKSYFTFKAIFERGSAKLIAFVAVSPHYPSVAPLFVLQVDWKEISRINDADVQDLEREVNVYWEELVNENTRDHLLSNQIYHLMLCFDLYLETESACETSKTLEFPREKNLVRFKSGRNRSKPYKYVKHLGMFLHR